MTVTNRCVIVAGYTCGQAAKDIEASNATGYQDGLKAIESKLEGANTNGCTLGGYCCETDVCSSSAVTSRVAAFLLTGAVATFSIL